MGLVSKTFDNIGQKIGEGYAKQGKSWDEVVNMPSSGSGLGKAIINSSAKTGYDNYMAGITGNQYGGIIEEATNKVLDSDTNMFKQFILLEGHMRLAYMRGQIKHGIEQIENQHDIWLVEKID